MIRRAEGTEGHIQLEETVRESNTLGKFMVIATYSQTERKKEIEQ